MNSALVKVILCFAATAADSSTLPIYVNYLDALSKTGIFHHHKSCDITNCYKEVLENPVFIVTKSKEEARHEVYYAANGLNSLTKDTEARPVNEAIRAADKVAVIYPHDQFPFDQFPGILEMKFDVPKHKLSFGEFFKDTPILVLYSNEDFSKLNDKMNYVRVADLDVQVTGLSLFKEYSVPTAPSDIVEVNEHSALFYILPATTPAANHRHSIHYLVPSSDRFIPFQSSIVAYSTIPAPNSIPSGFGASSPFF